MIDLMTNHTNHKSIGTDLKYLGYVIIVKHSILEWLDSGK